MVAINLFHEPTFREKLNGIGSTRQLHALMASMLAFAARFHTSAADDGTDSGSTEQGLQPVYLLNLAFSLIDEALKECDDEAPPLCLLQAIIIATHCQLTQGVRGKAWRSLGTCIRLAYELNLHLLDADRWGRYPVDCDATQWCEDEEKRRAWWAIWEMDVFASTIRRTPPAMDWSQMEVWLPAEDQNWFRNQPQLSCLMSRDPVYRWNALQECGNNSPKAWFLVINSLMKDAQVISTPRGIPHRISPQRAATTNAPKHAGDQPRKASRRLEVLANSVHCFTVALPKHLRFRNQYLWFSARTPGELLSQRQLHCGIYNIFVMTQLARLMIYRYSVFGGQMQDRPGAGGNPRADTSQQASHGTIKYDAENLALQQYFEATDNILTIIGRSSEEHIKHINPFLSSTIWLASAVQILRMQFAEDDISRTLIKSKFESLHLTYKQCVAFWDTHTALQENMEALEAQLESPENSPSANHQERHPTVSTSHNTMRVGTPTPLAEPSQPRNGRLKTPRNFNPGGE